MSEEGGSVEHGEVISDCGLRNEEGHKAQGSRKVVEPVQFASFTCDLKAPTYYNK